MTIVEQGILSTKFFAGGNIPIFLHSAVKCISEILFSCQLRIFDFFRVILIFISPNEHQKQYFHSGESMSDKISFGVHDRKLKLKLTLKSQIFCSFMLQYCNNLVYSNEPFCAKSDAPSVFLGMILVVNIVCNCK